MVHQIESLILEGVLRGGDRLPGERELARQFDISRPILRDALKRLETAGLLTSRHGGGTFSLPMSSDRFRSAPRGGSSLPIITRPPPIISNIAGRLKA